MQQEDRLTLVGKDHVHEIPFFCQWKSGSSTIFCTLLKSSDVLWPTDQSHDRQIMCYALEYVTQCTLMQTIFFKFVLRELKCDQSMHPHFVLLSLNAA